MSTSVLAPLSSSTKQGRPHRIGMTEARREHILSAGVIVLLTFLALMVHGYHPDSEDGGLYAAGIKRLLNPHLYPHNASFVEAHLRFSFFAPGIATVVRLTHLKLPVVLLAAYLLSMAATLSGVHLLARRCYTSTSAQFGATALTAAWLTMPVAGTSLILVDPYVTARSISLPCTLFALVAAIDALRANTRRAQLAGTALCGAMLLVALLAHPLMAAYATGDVLLLMAILSPSQRTRRWGTVSICGFAFVAAGLLQVVSPVESPAYVQVAITRCYWFFSRWQWYEIAGLAAPLFILIVTAFGRQRSNKTDQAASAEIVWNALACMAVASGITASLVALAFAHENSAAHLVARLQPLRAFQTIYLLMILVLGATLGEHLLRRRPWRRLIAFALLGSIMFYVQRSTYPSSAHIEWPGSTPVNRWQQAFLWISRHTPTDARFALDADYISKPGEDAQSFRAIAERSTLPDYSKDGGEASITPRLATAWVAGQLAQHQLSAATDAERLRALRPFNVDWVVLQQHAQTAFACPYQNDQVKVCRLP